MYAGAEAGDWEQECVKCIEYLKVKDFAREEISQETYTQAIKVNEIPPSPRPGPGMLNRQQPFEFLLADGQRLILSRYHCEVTRRSDTHA